MPAAETDVTLPWLPVTCTCKVNLKLMIELLTSAFKVAATCAHLSHKYTGTMPDSPFDATATLKLDVVAATAVLKQVAEVIATLQTPAAENLEVAYKMNPSMCDLRGWFTRARPCYTEWG